MGDYPDPRTPRTKDGQPDLTAPAPRLHGTPDLSGIWQSGPVPLGDIRRQSIAGPLGITVGTPSRRSRQGSLRIESAPMFPVMPRPFFHGTLLAFVEHR